jgi:hypothetical protein
MILFLSGYESGWIHGHVNGRDFRDGAHDLHDRGGKGASGGMQVAAGKEARPSDAPDVRSTKNMLLQRESQPTPICLDWNVERVRYGLASPYQPPFVQ